MPQCNRCGEEIGWKNFGTTKHPKWVPWDPRLDVAHECPHRDGTPKKKADPLRGQVGPPRDHRVVSAPTQKEETRITKLWVR